MQQIADWLEKLGMSEYAQRFAKNRIDLSVLPDPTDQQVKDLGIALAGQVENASRDPGACLLEQIGHMRRHALTEQPSQQQ